MVWRFLEAFELTGEIGLRYMLVLLIIVGLLVSANVVFTGVPFDYGFMKGILDSVFSLVVLVGMVVIARELWFFRVGLQAVAGKHKRTLERAQELIKKYG